MFNISAMAQSAARVTIFGGYSYFDGSFTALVANNPQGWNAAFTVNLNRWIGLTADVSGFSQSDQTGGNAAVYNLLFGPTASVNFHRFTPFAHFLIGQSRVSPSGFIPLTSQRSFAYAVGGGLDYALVRHVGIRGQIDMLHNNFTTSDNQISDRVSHDIPRISTGIVVRF